MDNFFFHFLTGPNFSTKVYIKSLQPGLIVHRETFRSPTEHNSVEFLSSFSDGFFRRRNNCAIDLCFLT